MIAARSFANADVGVFGLARSGVSSVRALKAGGARIFGWDDNQAGRDAAAREGASVKPFAEWPWANIKALILSPGVPLTHPRPHDVVLMAQKFGAEVVGDMELFAREIRSDRAKPGKAPVVAITGTNGKSTTTALIGHVLSSCGYAAEIGGNIGKPVLDLASPNGKTVYVLEVSSYQADLSPGLTPDVAVLTNITPDHIDRHGSLENYAAVKARLLAQTAKTGQICIGVDDIHASSLYTRFSSNGGPEAIPVSVGKVLGRGVFAVDGTLYDAVAGRAAPVMNLGAAAHLPGAHNWQNAALAYAATKPFVKDTRAIASAIADFPGLPHRMEDVGRIGKVRFINDSKATNADAAERALVCFPDVFWIAGVKAKEGGIESLAPLFSRIRKAYLIGEAAKEFARTLEDRVPYAMSGTLEHAVAEAAADARNASVAPPVVLLSPACASFDQFRDFEHRGETFRALVAQLSSLERAAS
ncbi:MAG: UDP-N-acetylmuramoyl-L-alanine--D-glutamate ligase [Proteobacteria bacterium]|nr:UDP-N-acetylmuramoyl-L-alanine--D-glutamate ligase [Pseudomonadota bacterium]